MLNRSLVAKVLPGLAVSGVLIASLVASPAALFGSLSGYGYGVCGYGSNSYSGSATVTGVSPSAGTTNGGTVVFITGSGYCNVVSAVHFDTSPAQSINVLADTLIQAVTPAHAAGLVDVTVTNAAGTSAINPGDQYFYFPPTPNVYTSLSPQRILDTRTNGGTLGPGGSVTLSIGGVYVPAEATSVVLNVTTVDGSTAGFFTLYPTGGTTPTASNVNWVAGETVPNLVSVGLSEAGQVTLFNGLGSADAVVDLEGYFAPPQGGSAGQFTPLVPARITDTRAASGQTNHGKTLAAGTSLNVQVLGAGGVPSSGVSAVVLNVTAVDQTANGFFTVFPTGTGLPLASNLNWVPGDTVPNRVIVSVGTAGQVTIFNGLGSADAVVDVNGYFSDSTATGTSMFFPLFPSRIVDTRNGTGGFSAPLGAGATMKVTAAGHGGVPATGATAVIVNVTVANPTAASDLVVWPDLATKPTASDLNFVAGQTVPNLVVVQLSAAGQFDIFNAFGTTNVVVDVVGYYG
jgi:hypothetical protein